MVTSYPYVCPYRWGIVLLSLHLSKLFNCYFWMNKKLTSGLKLGSYIATEIVKSTGQNRRQLLAKKALPQELIIYNTISLTKALEEG